MIDIRFRPPAGTSGSLVVTGHASESGKGTDVVCAGVSSLVLTYLGGIESRLNAQIHGNISSGSCDVTMEVPPERSGTFNEVYHIFRFGFQRLAETYPETVRLIE